MTGTQETRTWLMLVHQFDADQGALKVRIWRRLKRIGAISVKNSVYLLPYSDASREDLTWIMKELNTSGASGVLMEATILGNKSEQQIIDAFNQARNEAYASVIGEMQTCLAALDTNSLSENELEQWREELAAWRKSIDEIQGIDFFLASRRAPANTLFDTLESRLTGGAEQLRSGEGRELDLAHLRGRTWVTRADVYVDRIASAWLIRQWIDPQAEFKFTADAGYAPASDEIRFDMYEAEFTHVGNQCTFEVLVDLLDRNDAALRRLAEIIHDIDLKDERYGHPETQGVAIVIKGLARSTQSDADRLERGAMLFDDLYRSLEAQ